MLRREIPTLRPVDHAPELEGGHRVIAAMIVIESTMRTSMLLFAEEPDRRAEFLIEFSFSVLTELPARPDDERLTRVFRLVIKLFIRWLRIQPSRSRIRLGVLFQQLKSIGQQRSGCIAPNSLANLFLSLLCCRLHRRRWSRFLFQRRAFYLWLPSARFRAPSRSLSHRRAFRFRRP